MRQNLADYAQRFQILCSHFLPVMHTFLGFVLYIIGIGQ